MQRVTGNKQAVVSPHWLDIISAIIPGFWLLAMNSYSAKWFYGAFNLFGALVISIALLTTVWLKKRYLSPWSWPLLAMLLWSGWRFINWTLSDRGMIWLVNYLNNTLNINLIRSASFVLLLIIATWGTYWIYKQLNGQLFRLKWNRILFGCLVALAILTTVYTGLERIQENCLGINLVMFELPCYFRTNIGSWGYVWFTLLMLLIPTTVALHKSKEYGLLASLIVVPFVPLWSEILFYPFQIFGMPLLNIIREPGACSICPVLENAIQISLYLPIIGYLIAIPIGMILINSESIQRWWVISVALITNITVYILVIRTLITAGSVLNSLSLDWIMFGLLLLELSLPLLLVVVDSPKRTANEL